MRYLASRTVFNDSPFARMITGFVNVLLFGCSSLFTGKAILMLRKLLGILIIGQLIVRILFVLSESVEN